MSTAPCALAIVCMLPLERFADHLPEIKEAIVYGTRGGVLLPLWRAQQNSYQPGASGTQRAGGFDLTKIPPLYNLSGGILQWYRLHQDSYV
jgi:hypothetical protein